MERKNKLWL